MVIYIGLATIAHECLSRRRYLKEIDKLKKLLEPKSTLHAQQDLQLLKKHVYELVDLVRRVGVDDWDVRMAEKGILKERVIVPRKVEKPQLVLDEGLEMEFI